MHTVSRAYVYLQVLEELIGVSAAHFSKVGEVISALAVQNQWNGIVE